MRVDIVVWTGQPSQVTLQLLVPLSLDWQFGVNSDAEDRGFGGACRDLSRSPAVGDGAGGSGKPVKTNVLI